MTISLLQLPGHDRLTGSRIGEYQTCPRREYYGYGLGVRVEQSPSYFRLGTNFHIGLDARAQGHTIEDSLAAAVVAYDSLPTRVRSAEKIHEWEVEREVVLRLLSGYWWYWERDEIRPDIHPVEIIETEGSFNIPIVNPSTGAKTPTFTFSGKRDKIVRLGDGRVAVMEHKTCGEDIGPEKDYWKRLRIDSQISGYMLAARAQGHEVETVLYDVTRKPTIQPKMIPVLDDEGRKIVVDPATGERQFKTNILKNGQPGKGHGEPYESANVEKGWIVHTRIETPTEYGDRLTDDISARPEFYFQRQEIPRLAKDLEEFATQLWQMQQQINESYRAGRHFRNTSACIGRVKCPYLDLCHNGIDLSQGIPTGFRQVTTLHEELD